MRYWILTSEYPPEYGGGIATYCYHNAQMLKEKGYEVSIFVTSEISLPEIIKFEHGIRVIRFNCNTEQYPHLGYETARSFLFARAIENHMAKEGIPDILESQEYGGIAYFTLLYKHLNYAFFGNLKVLLTLHAPAFLYYEYNKVPSYSLPYFWIGEMEKWCIHAADKLNSPGHFLINAIQPFFLESLTEKISIIRYPYKNVSPVTIQQNEIRNNWFFFGKMTPQKGIIPLLIACKKLWSKGWKRKLIIIGGGDHYYHPENMLMSDWIKLRFSAELRKQQLILLGNLSQENWTDKTKNGGIIIIPSIGDNYPFTVLESMSNGQIVLASKQGGQSEIIIHCKNGFLFDHTIHGDLEAKILLIESMPLNELQKIRQEAVRSVNNLHNYDKVFSEKKTLINNLLEQATKSDVFPFLRPQIKVRKEVSVKEIINNKLSIIIPFFNMGKTVKETLSSVYNIEYDNFEVIVINDGSTEEESVKELNKLQKAFGFRLINQSNYGLSFARNRGAEEASGEYIAFIDADDKIDPKFYRAAISVLQSKSNVYFVGSWVRYFENSNGIWPSFTPELPYLLYYNMVCGGGLVYKKIAYLEAGKNDEALEYGLEDWESVLSLVKSGRQGIVLPEPFYQYRIRKGSMARRFTSEKILYSIKYITNKHSDVFSEYAQDLTLLLNANGPGYKIDNPTLDYSKRRSLPKWLPFKSFIFYSIRKHLHVKKFALKIYKAVKK
ncbi:glycosyltransferase involved in cell wall biosynthesis [Lacibacter cauensis]|uniref:Glycosyltransferase involved in cell wall biosynthesis n=1 Tax=Lacibacter cauensis TaxID=510947 RepID=A0A562SRB2_9BACT|nr:glycosyltransferase [Lacibacter cauensis]TWI83673.1 glycosyltransferase involved in cell wall biosynthesis [Lacibacter cauensis]